MIGFVTWPPFLYYHIYQVTKPIIVVKMLCKLLYVIQVAKRLAAKKLNFLALLDIRIFGRL